MFDRTKSNFFNILVLFRVRFNRTELCFIAFEWFYMMTHLNDFYELGSIEPNREILKKFDSVRSNKFELIRLNSIWFGSVRYYRKVLEYHCNVLRKFFKKLKSRLIWFRQLTMFSQIFILIKELLGVRLCIHFIIFTIRLQLKSFSKLNQHLNKKIKGFYRNLSLISKIKSPSYSIFKFF